MPVGPPQLGAAGTPAALLGTGVFSSFPAATPTSSTAGLRFFNDVSKNLDIAKAFYTVIYENKPEPNNPGQLLEIQSIVDQAMAEMQKAILETSPEKLNFPQFITSFFLEALDTPIKNHSETLESAISCKLGKMDKTGKPISLGSENRNLLKEQLRSAISFITHDSSFKSAEYPRKEPHVSYWFNDSKK